MRSIERPMKTCPTMACSTSVNSPRRTAMTKNNSADVVTSSLPKCLHYCQPYEPDIADIKLITMLPVLVSVFPRNNSTRPTMTPTTPTTILVSIQTLALTTLTTATFLSKHLPHQPYKVPHLTRALQ